MQQADIDRYCSRPAIVSDASAAAKLIADLYHSDCRGLNLSTFIPQVLHPAIVSAISGVNFVEGIATALNLCTLSGIDVSKYHNTVRQNEALTTSDDRLRAVGIVCTKIVEMVEIMQYIWSSDITRRAVHTLTKFYRADDVYSKPIMVTKIIVACGKLSLKDCWQHADFVKEVLYRAVLMWFSHRATRPVVKRPELAIAICMCTHHLGAGAFTDEQLRYAERCSC